MAATVLGFVCSLLLATAFANELYNYSAQKCCNGTLNDLPDREKYYSYCCGTGIINSPYVPEDGYVEPLCCGGDIYPNPQPNDACCGEQIIDTDTHACIDYTVPVQRTEEARQQGLNSVCGNKTDPPQFYNSTLQLCCDGVLNPRTDDYTGCCGSLTYNYSTSLCCDGKVIETGDTANITCCGSTYYNYLTSRCCVTYENDVTQSAVFDFEGDSLYEVGCCGLQLFNYTSQVCCKSGPKDKASPMQSSCCGDEVMSANELCVNEQLVARNNDYEYVCGEHVYDEREFACWREQLVEIEANQTICYFNGIPYDYSTQVCSYTCVVDVSAEDRAAGKTEYCEPYSYNVYY